LGRRGASARNYPRIRDCLRTPDSPSNLPSYPRHRRRPNNPTAPANDENDRNKSNNENNHDENANDNQNRPEAEVVVNLMSEAEVIVV